jgi:hypothetical protein
VCFVLFILNKSLFLPTFNLVNDLQLEEGCSFLTILGRGGVDLNLLRSRSVPFLLLLFCED